MTRPNQTDIPYHRTSCSVYKPRGVSQGLPITAQGPARHRSVGGKNCIAHLFFISFLFGFYSSPLHSSFRYNGYYFVSIIKWFLSQPSSCTFSPSSPPHPLWAQGERVSSCVVLSCHLALNHDTHRELPLLPVPVSFPSTSVGPVQR